MSYPFGQAFFRSPSTTAGTGGTMIAFATFTPTGLWSTNCTYTGGYSRLGEYMMINVKLALSGAPDSSSGSLTINMPTGFSMDSGKIGLAAGSRQQILAGGFLDDSGGSAYPLHVSYNTPTSFLLGTLNGNVIAGGTFVVRGGLSATLPTALGASDVITMWAQVPIIGWAP